jgi:hypothetical protein
MDGINPTLAFAALFFGLSGHHATHNSPVQQLELQNSIDCPVLMISGHPPATRAQQTLSEAFEISLPGAAGGDDKLTDAASGPINPDPIARQIVPVAASARSMEPDPELPCAPGQ